MPFAKLRSRIGVPQVVALLLLLVFVVQCLWFMAHVPLSAMEGSYIEAGLLHLEHLSNASSSERSALVPLLAGLAARMSGAENRIVELSDYRFVIRAPFLVAGLLLGASLWFVARRLYGNVGGYIALGLYCFSPVMIGWSSQVGPGIVAAWGGFGLIFTAIAVAHTLYAPREVVLWNWRRILLMGLSIAICIGAQFSLWILLVPALGFMLWVGHVRPGAALAIFAAACVTGLLLLWALYSFRPAVFGMALRNADWLEVSAVDPSWRSHLFLVCRFLPAERNRFSFIAGSHAGHVHRLEARTLFRNSGSARRWRACWSRRSLVCTSPGFTFLLVALPFLILFMAGVSTDLLEGRYALAANAVIGGVLIANAMIDVYGLLHLTSRSQ